MDHSLFRKQSIDRISSPEELHDYLRVTSPRMWMLLIAILALMFGFLNYAASTKIENVLPVKVEAYTYEKNAEDDNAGEPQYATYISGHLPLQMLETIQVGMKVRVAEHEGSIYYISTAFDDEDDSTSDELYFYVELEEDYLPGLDGECDAEIVLESTTPISYLWSGV